MGRFHSWLWMTVLSPFVFFVFLCGAPAQDTKLNEFHNAAVERNLKESNQWFYRGRIVAGLPSAELRRRAYQAKMQLRTQRAKAFVAPASPNSQPSLSSGSWVPIGPAPLASDASGNGTQDYHQVAGRATAVVIDPADSSGNTVYIGGAQGGVWKSTNAAAPSANNVTWTPLTDSQVTLSIGAIAIQPGNSDPAKSVVLAATGEADSSGDSYFGLGILRSADGGNNWSLISSANNGSLSFSGLGGTRMAFSTASGQASMVVAAMATTSEGLIDGAVTSATMRGLYTSLDAGQSWTYRVPSDPGGQADATSATSVVYNLSAGLFFAAIRYHGFYSSPDGVTWTRLANQPGGSVLGPAACPAQSMSNNQACPIYRGEITVVPGRNEMYAWYIFLSSGGTPTDGGIWQSLDGGASWRAISSSGITNCGDTMGCGVEQGAYNLDLLAVANGAGTDLYAGAVNLYKCAINSINPTCANSPFMNLTHAYGCVPAGAPAHVHPGQHAITGMTPTVGSDSGNELLYLANDGGIYRALNGFSGLNSGACSGTNLFDDLNQNLGSLAQFVSFSQHPTDADTLLGGARGNGFPATNQATTNSSWINVLGGDGGSTAIDPTAPLNWYASSPDLAPGGLGIQLCTNGISCNNGAFEPVVTSGTLGGDDGGFYFPYILDQRSSTTMLVGTCRVWRGPRTGGAFVALSPNFDTLGSGACSGTEVNQIRAMDTGGLADQTGSSVIYATTSGLGPIAGPSQSPPGGRVWVTTEASIGAPGFTDVTGNGLQGSINPNQYPISGVAIDTSNGTGNTAYVTIMGFTGGSGHVWKTTNAGASWTDFTGNLPDSPANAVVVYPAASLVFVATDVGVFASPTSGPSWTELGPVPSPGQPGFLPNVAVTDIGVFASGGQQLLRASTYGRGLWQFNLVITPDFQFSISNSTQTVFAGQTATFNGTMTALNGYTNSVTLSCVAGATAPPSTCTALPVSLTPVSKTPFTLTAGGSPGDYSFKLQGRGSDVNHITHTVPVVLHLVSYGLTPPSPASVTVNRGSTSSPVTFQITAAGSFNQSVSVSCTSTIPNSACNLSPASLVTPTSTIPVNMTAAVSVPAGTSPGSYPVNIQATSTGGPTLSASFTLNVTANPDFVLTAPAFPEVNVGSSGTTGAITITSQDGFTGTVSLSCPTTYGAGSCSISPASVSSFPASAALTINGTSFAAGKYSLTISGTSGSITHSLAIPFNVGDYAITGTQTVAGVPGRQANASFTLTPAYGYTGKITATCNASALASALCTLSPPNPIGVSGGGTVNLDVTISIPNDALPGNYPVNISTQDTAGAPRHPASFSLILAPGFLVTSSTASQTVTAGQTSGAYNLRVLPIGPSFNAPISLACTAGLPVQAQCLFNPSTPVTPGGSAVDVVMSISTKAASANTTPSLNRISLFSTGGLLFAGVLGVFSSGWSRSGKNRIVRLGMMFAVLFCLLAWLPSCSGVSNNGSGGGSGPPPVTPVTYHITVTGSSSGTPSDPGQSTTVALVVN